MGSKHLKTVGACDWIVASECYQVSIFLTLTRHASSVIFPSVSNGPLRRVLLSVYGYSSATTFCTNLLRGRSLDVKQIKRWIHSWSRFSKRSTYVYGFNKWVPSDSSSRFSIIHLIPTASCPQWYDLMERFSINVVKWRHPLTSYVFPWSEIRDIRDLSLNHPLCTVMG